ncbi:chemotaxis protein CheA [Poseidonibacter sp.]|uniref:chemotaxis protein CheA n=1 Tax=Poseidonibacter sp. TaxID=2321188 RepID=UPI00359CF688
MEEIKKTDIEKTETILVDLDKIEKLVNKVADLVITNSMMSQKIESLNDEEDKRNMSGITTLFERHIKEIQDYAMELRMINMASIYEKFPLLIESTASKYNKKIQINTSGNNTKIDKSMLESLDETLKLILENSLIHGIEEPKIRIEKQKNEIGLISVNTEQINGQIVITIKDDGKGIDLESIVNNALEKLFINEDDLENMSDNDKSALILNEKSMSKVKEYVEKINGQLFIETKKDRGTTVTIFIPLTLSILDGLNIRIGEQYFILPTTSIIESLQPTKDIIKSVGDGSSELLILREDFIPIIRMNQYLNIKGQHTNLTDGMIIVVKAGKEKVALFIDEFLHQQQIVVKAIDKNFRDVIGISGATVRGNGSIGLIIDVKSIVDDKR